jgi:hypothetical protein
MELYDWYSAKYITGFMMSKNKVCGHFDGEKKKARFWWRNLREMGH